MTRMCAMCEHPHLYDTPRSCRRWAIARLRDHRRQLEREDLTGEHRGWLRGEVARLEAATRDDHAD